MPQHMNRANTCTSIIVYENNWTPEGTQSLYKYMQGPKITTAKHETKAKKRFIITCHASSEFSCIALLQGVQLYHRNQLETTLMIRLLFQVPTCLQHLLETSPMLIIIYWPLFYPMPLAVLLISVHSTVFFIIPRCFDQFSFCECLLTG